MVIGSIVPGYWQPSGQRRNAGRLAGAHSCPDPEDLISPAAQRSRGRSGRFRARERGKSILLRTSTPARSPHAYGDATPARHAWQQKPQSSNGESKIGLGTTLTTLSDRLRGREWKATRSVRNRKSPRLPYPGPYRRKERVCVSFGWRRVYHWRQERLGPRLCGGYDGCNRQSDRRIPPI